MAENQGNETGKGAKRQRRQFSAVEKRRLLDETEKPGESVSTVARRYSLSPSMLFAYHPESIARARRQLRDAKIITSERVFVGGKIPSLKAKFTSSRGTTVKAFMWRAIEQKNPFTRCERRIKRQEQARATRETGEPRKAAPRYVAARAIVEHARPTSNSPASPCQAEVCSDLYRRAQPRAQGG